MALLLGLTTAVAPACSSDDPFTGVPVTTPLVAVSSGVLHSCALDGLGAGYCWGWNRDGQLGDGSRSDRHVPTSATDLELTAIAAGGGHTCGLTASGQAYCWGLNLSGQLGDGTRTGRTTPRPIAGAGAFATISPGGAYTCAIDTQGGAFCWGLGTSGQLGNGGTSDVLEPTPVASGLQFASIATGVSHTCALTTVGDAYCWGANGFRQLGTAAVGSQPEPAAVQGGLQFEAITVGTDHSCGLTLAAELYCWGDNSQGQVGTGDSTTATYAAPTLVAGGLIWRSVSAAAGSFTCGATTDTQGYCWGANASGQLGHESSELCSVDGFPQACTRSPREVSGGLAFDVIDANTQHACGLVGGLAYCWGLNNHGQLGYGGTASSSVPVRVANQQTGT